MLEEWRNQNKSLKSNSERGGIDILDNNSMDSSIALTTVIRIRVSVWVGLLSLRVGHIGTGNGFVWKNFFPQTNC